MTIDRAIEHIEKAERIINDQNNDIEKLYERIDNARDYLMSTQQSEITAEDVLEALGFNRNGFED